ncbi:MAG: 50S ribosomal protein L7/L12 [Planctomycetes bacterium]|nr:50S ribosomal protein L7/L12 [Planctomycetota bacterium]
MDNVKTLKDEEKSQLLLEVISNSSVSWLKDFVKSFEDKFGVSAAMPVMAAAGPAAAAGAGEAEKKEEKSSFDIILQDAGANKIQVIKVIRAITNLGLKEAKTLTDTPPQPVKTGVPKEEAEKILKELAAAGAKVELK